MKLKQWIKIMLVAGCAVALVACSTTKKTDDSAVDDANSAYDGDNMDDGKAESKGLSDSSNFGDEGSSGRKLASNNHTYYFDFDSNVVRDTDKPAIHSNANYLTAHANTKIRLEGNTDPRGSREYNIALGERRAKAVAQILTEKGVSPAQVRVVSYGAQKLASTGHSEEDYKQDRRAVIVYTK